MYHNAAGNLLLECFQQGLPIIQSMNLPMPTQAPLCFRSIAQVLKNHGAKWELTKGHKLTPVLAVGSNAAPAQLARKFPPEMFPEGVVIPVLRCVLPDFDVVYAPLISSYGSCTGECSLQA